MADTTPGEQIKCSNWMNYEDLDRHYSMLYCMLLHAPSP